MENKLQKRIDEIISLSVGSPSFTDTNAGNNIDKHVEKYPNRMGGELGSALGGFGTRDEVQSQSLPYPLERSVDNLADIYGKLLEYRAKLREASLNPQMSKSKRKMKVLKHMRKRLTVMMKMTRLLASRLDSISMEERPVEQIGMEQDRLNNFDSMDSALDMGQIEKKKDERKKQKN